MVNHRARVRILVLFASLLVMQTAVRAEPFRLVSHNVWYGFNKVPERKSKWLDWMQRQNPDVVSLQELNGYDEQKLKSDAAKWGHGHVAFLAKSDFCMGLTSRKPISEVKRIVDGMHHGLLRCKVGDAYYYVIHFHPSNCEHRIAEANILLADAATLPKDAPTVLIGDFNGFSPVDRPQYDADERIVPFFDQRDEKLGERNLFQHAMDYRGVSVLLSAGFADLVAKHRESFVGTFPTKLRANEDHGSDRRLDYVMVRNWRMKPVSAQIIRDELTAMMSDHYPVVVEFDRR